MSLSVRLEILNPVVTAWSHFDQVERVAKWVNHIGHAAPDAFLDFPNQLCASFVGLSFDRFQIVGEEIEMDGLAYRSLFPIPSQQENRDRCPFEFCPVIIQASP